MNVIEAPLLDRSSNKVVVDTDGGKTWRKYRYDLDSISMLVAVPILCNIHQVMQKAELYFHHYFVTNIE